MSRSVILTRLRQAVPQSAPDQIEPQTAPATSSGLQVDQRPGTFAAAWEALGATWELQQDGATARLAFLLYLREQGIRFIVAWPPSYLPLEGLQEGLDDAGIQLLAPNRRDIDPDIVVGLTSASAGLATTGSLVFVPEPGRSWLPSLLPIRHLVLLPTSLIYADLHDWRQSWVASGKADDLARALISTGPSFSSDIELHAHRGMFGPRLMHVLLIQDT